MEGSPSAAKGPRTMKIPTSAGRGSGSVAAPSPSGLKHQTTRSARGRAPGELVPCRQLLRSHVAHDAVRRPGLERDDTAERRAVGKAARGLVELEHVCSGRTPTASDTSLSWRSSQHASTSPITRR